MNKIRYYILALSCALSCIFGISFFFYSDSIISEFLYKALGLKISSGFVGGEILQDVFDQEGDDNGDGTFVYPEYDSFTESSLDLIRYTVHQPAYEARWQENPEYWQLDFEFASGSNGLRNLMVYIGADNMKENSTEPLFPGTEISGFEKAHPWSIALLINESQSVVYNCKKEIICSTENYTRKDGRELLVRIPLQNKELQKLYTAGKTYHYVFSGAYSKWDKDGFIHFQDKTIYDLLDPDETQKLQLSSRKFSPVEINMNEKAATDYSDFIAEIKARYKEISPELSPTATTSEPESSLALAEQGVEIAIKGGNSNPMQGMKLVNDAFVYLDKAAELAKNTDDEFEVLLNRAGVASSVPETVFKKSEVAARDYLRVAKIYQDKIDGREYSPQEKITTAYYYVLAAENFKKASKDTEYRMCINKAEKFYNL